jgi:large subunit ribosomal protein L25
MLQVTMPSAKRSVFGKGPMRRLRSDGKTPAVMYSGGKDPLALEFDTPLLFKNLLYIHGRNAVVSLEIEGDDQKNRQVLVQEIQKDPVSDRLIHVDFLEIDVNKPMEFQVPINLVGVARGVDMGGELVVHASEVRLRGCPLDLPDAIEMDITELDRGEAGLTFGDLPLPDNVELLDDSEKTFVEVQ